MLIIDILDVMDVKKINDLTKGKVPVKKEELGDNIASSEIVDKIIDGDIIAQTTIKEATK